MSEDEKFSWADTEAIVVGAVAAIAVYTNPEGQILVRQQETSSYRDEDPFIVIPRDRVNDVIAALKKELEG